ncbi:NUDIX hydrolase [Streptomyces sp. HNM0574]|uniref:NUDIX hydrolase n=1 Tax=Streptomyces sp. HNM0574 TaxID=2714954 RepID=UPI00146B5888|nr:NUDIX hydrolase [Streptomyces sp. HNM0574]NLU70388.1 NUDIX hydrolase [Streptomyces sp. HNM0574]
MTAHGNDGGNAYGPRIAAAVVAEAGRVLLVRRRVPEPGLRWQFPAGAVEPGESAEQAAVRETLEETGLTLAPVAPLGRRIHPHTGRTVVYTACRVLAGRAHVAAPAEIDAVAWLTAARLPHGLFPPVRAHLDRLLGP